MHYALKVWSDITPLNFHEVAGNRADIQIDFSTADHNDRYPFDGPGGAVAHAFLPGDHHTAGDTHFDDDEAWTFRSSGASGLSVSLCGPYVTQGPQQTPWGYREPHRPREDGEATKAHSDPSPVLTSSSGGPLGSPSLASHTHPSLAGTACPGVLDGFTGPGGWGTRLHGSPLTV